MSDINTLFNDVMNAPADSALANEAKAQTSFQAVPTGSYTLQAADATVEAAGEKSPWPGRLLVRIKAKATGTAGSGTIFFDMSPVVHRTQSGRLDGPSVLWGNVISAFGMEGATNLEIVQALKQYPLQGYIEKAYNTGASWVTAKTEAEAKALDKQGYTPRNFVRNLKAVTA